MKHILGMAKSHLDLRGAKGPKLELDFLRLAYSVRRLEDRGEEAQGYLLVVSKPAERCALSWIEKYDSGNRVHIIYKPLSPAQLQVVSDEKARNIKGMIAGSLGNVVGGLSSAVDSGRIGEELLAFAIEEKEVGVVRVTETAKQLFGIRWDYYGVVAGAG